jgi:hypothetical protein
MGFTTEALRRKKKLEKSFKKWMHSFEAPRPQGGASRARSGEQNVSQGNFIYCITLAL